MLEQPGSPTAQASKPRKLKSFRAKPTQHQRREAETGEKGEKRGRKGGSTIFLSFCIFDLNYNLKLKLKINNRLNWLDELIQPIDSDLMVTTGQPPDRAQKHRSTT
ncbi:hypothetical protein SLEP1_g5301 [Rubroshorea leprosula]|uniref:Uncharacterized protein n=1 Tax=Rubroshorea leprosula TaxID=152421 RepID=A0AAV5HVU0_9ROSI|nr:hypothetical protein SLEP1_g5301 [Rubroshorea leprosula]